MLETSARLLHLLSLFQGRRYWPGAELAVRLEITTRTLRRDIDKLRSLGYLVESRSGAEGGYQLAPATMAPPLWGNEEGAVVLAAPPSTPDARTLSTIAGACRNRKALRFGYESHSGETTARAVEPHRMVHTGSRWYLVAWDTGRGAWRTFRVDRIRSRLVIGSRFPPRDPPAEDLAAYVKKGIWQAPPCRGRVKVRADAAATARLCPWAVLIEPMDDVTSMLEVSGWSYENIAMGLAWLGVDFEVTGPPELLTEVRRIARRYQRAVKRSPRRS